MPLWRAEGGAWAAGGVGGERRHVGVEQLVEDFAQYAYLPRVRDGSVITATLEDGVDSLSREIDGLPTRTAGTRRRNGIGD